MNSSEEGILSVSSFYVLLRFSCRLIVYFCFLFCFTLFVCLFVILLKKRENGRAMGSRHHLENRALYFDIFKFSKIVRHRGHKLTK